jgi:hypothetical protein
MAQSRGRPTKYNETVQAKADDYARNPEDYGDVVPTAAGLSLILNVTKSTLYKWAEEHPIFSDTLSSLNATQEKRLINGSLMGDYNATISKLMLSNHGYREKSEVDNLSSDGSMTPQKIERIIVQAENI